MISHPPGPCCFQGVRHEGNPTGAFATIGDFEVYTAYPKDKSTEYGILFITDVLGHRFPNAQLIADQYAANGYFVLMPDLFYGDPVPIDNTLHSPFDIGKWMQGEFNEKKIAHLPRVIDPIIGRCIEEMRYKYMCKRIGGAGYCFGGKYVIRNLGHLGPNKLDVVYTAHPTGVEVDELKAVTGPLAISAAEVDSYFPTEKRREAQEILVYNSAPHQINIYSGVPHGFATRCDLKDPVQRHTKESAFLQAVIWFEEHLKQ